MNQKSTQKLLFLPFLLLFLGIGSALSPLKASVNRTNAPAMELKVRVEGVADTTCFLGYHFGDKQYLRDTVDVDSKGWMTFTSDTLLPGGIYLVVLPSKNYFEVILDQDQQFTLETKETELVQAMKVKGSQENKVFYDYLHFIEEQRKSAEPLREKLGKTEDEAEKEKIQEEMRAVDQKVIDYQKDIIQNHSNLFVAALIKASQEQPVPEAPEELSDSLARIWVFNEYRDHYLDNIDFCDDRLLRTPIMHQRVMYYLEKLTYQFPDSLCKATEEIVEKSRCNDEVFRYFIITLTNKYASSKVMGHDQVYVCMAEKYYLTKQAYWADSTMLSKIEDRVRKIKPNFIGVKAKDIFMKDMHGKPVNLYGVDAKYTILLFWDSTCGHCKKEVPKLYEVFQKFKGEGKSVMGFAVTNEIVDETWLEFIEEHEFNDWINAIDMERRSPFRQFYDVYSTPVIYLLNEDKEIILKRVSAEQVDEFLSREFDMPYEKPAPKEDGENGEDEH